MLSLAIEAWDKDGLCRKWLLDDTSSHSGKHHTQVRHNTSLPTVLVLLGAELFQPHPAILRPSFSQPKLNALSRQILNRALSSILILPFRCSLSPHPHGLCIQGDRKWSSPLHSCPTVIRECFVSPTYWSPWWGKNCLLGLKIWPNTWFLAL